MLPIEFSSLRYILESGEIRVVLSGVILYFDDYGNAITNIRREDAPESFWQNVHIRMKNKNRGPMKSNYEGNKKQPVALFNSFSFLEIAWPCGSAQKKMGLKAGDPVTVKAGT